MNGKSFGDARLRDARAHRWVYTERVSPFTPQMPTSPRLRELDRQLAAVARPALEPMGYIAGSGRAFRRIRSAEHGTLVHIVHFQVGIKSLAGKFTANLYVSATLRSG